MQKGDLPKAIECLNKALNINKLYPQTWFTLGCIYMRVSEFSKAAYAFGNVISLDNQMGDAWSNLASCNMSMKKFKEA
jgi:Tfp pilus assembly protein PilF